MEAVMETKKKEFIICRCGAKVFIVDGLVSRCLQCGDTYQWIRGKKNERNKV